MHKLMGSILTSLLLLMMFSGCEEKAIPIKEAPSETQEESHERGYIETH